MPKRRNYQQGYVVLATSLIILFVATLVTLYSTSSSIAEEKVSNNDYKIRTAFEAADAGIEFGIAYIKINHDAIIVNNGNGFLTAYSSPNITNVPLTNGTSFTISYTNPVVNNFNLIQVVSTGKSADGTVTRTVTQLLNFRPFLVTQPPGGIVAKNNVSLSGNVNIANTVTGLAIWSGGSATLSGAASTTGINGIPSIQQNDSNLSSMTSAQFFQSFFGTDEANAQQYAGIVYNNSGDTDYSSLLNGVTGQVIWINQTGGTAKINSNVTIGSPTDPVVLVVNGNLTLNGNATLYGVLFVANQWTNNGGGNFDLIGSAIVDGAVQSTGTPNVNYQPPVVNNTQKLGDYVKVPGSWHDF